MTDWSIFEGIDKLIGIITFIPVVVAIFILATKSVDILVVITCLLFTTPFIAYFSYEIGKKNGPKTQQSQPTPTQLVVNHALMPDLHAISPQEWGISGIFTERNDAYFGNNISTANSIDIVGGSLDSYYAHFSDLTNMIVNGGEVRIIMLPRHGINTLIQAKAHFKKDEWEKYFKDVQTFFAALSNYLDKKSTINGSLEIKVFKEPYVPYCGFTIWNSKSDNEKQKSGVSFLPFYNVNTSIKKWPLFQIKKFHNDQGFLYFKEVFNLMWNDNLRTELIVSTKTGLKNI